MLGFELTGTNKNNLNDYLDEIGFITDVHYYLKKAGIKIENKPKINEEIDILNEIFALEVSLLIMMNVPGALGEHIDELFRIRRNYISRYELKFKRPYAYFNEELL